MCQIWLRSDGRVEKGGGVTDRQTDRQSDTASFDPIFVYYYFITSTWGRVMSKKKNLNDALGRN